MVAYTPVYCSATRIPNCYNTPGADAVTFSMDNAFWVCNWVSNMVYPRYSQMFPSLEQVRDSLDNSYLSQQALVEEKAKQMDGAAAAKYLNDYSCQKCEEMIARWRQLATYLIVKYNDMVVKKENADGSFMLSKHGIGERPVRPGYPNKYAKELIKQTGTKFEVVK